VVLREGLEGSSLEIPCLEIFCLLYAPFLYNVARRPHAIVPTSCSLMAVSLSQPSLLYTLPCPLKTHQHSVPRR
jgi:hypothetical protein